MVYVILFAHVETIAQDCMDFSKNVEGQRALIVVDMQYDFLPTKGALGVAGGDKILPFIYSMLARADEYCMIVASLVRTCKVASC